MRYTVYHPQSDPSRSYGSYLRLLEESGVNIADTDRVLEPASALRFLPIWDAREAAEHFASLIRTQTEDTRWAVHSLNGESVSHGPLGPVWIDVGKDSYGYIYGLPWESRTVIEKRFPDAIMLERLAVDSRNPGVMESRQAHLWQKIAEMLTGLTAEQLAALGGFRFYSPKTKCVWGHAPQCV